MNAVGFLFTLITGWLLFVLPRRWAALPLLIGAAYMTRGQVLDLGPLHFPVIRILVVVGFVRVILKKERIAGGVNRLDRMLILWAIWLVCSSAFHTADAWIFRFGVVLNDLGSYFLFRIFIRNTDDILRLFKVLCILLVPVALAMIVERRTGKNCFASLGGVLAEADLRRGQFRASGPWVSAILSGTVGAVCLPMALFLCRKHRKLALTGLAATCGIVWASGASGPVMALLSILFALGLWKVRGYLQAILWAALLLVIALDIVMNDPVYFLLARIDITGGSTGWHRAELIRAAIEHLGEWWLAGTDRTRHWMPTGIYANEQHTDITNHYLQMGVWGGLPLMFLFIGVICVTFGVVGKALRKNKHASVEHRYLIWTLGAILFGHVTNFFSISYFDQSIVFLYLLFASIGALPAINAAPAPYSQKRAEWASPDYGSSLCHNC